MQKWEYLTVKIEYFGMNGQYLAARTVNGQELKNWKQTSLDRYVNQLGEMGWEMCGIINQIPGHLFFKRPKP